ncbi:hypothetical protein ACK36D_15745 [Aeromonas veronii]
MSTSEQSDPVGQAKSRYDSALPTGYDWRRHRRFILSGGGYKAQCSRRNWFLELLNPVPYVVVRDIAIGGIGILGAIRLKEGDELVIAIPSGEKLRGLCNPPPRMKNRELVKTSGNWRDKLRNSGACGVMRLSQAV